MPILIVPSHFQRHFEFPICTHLFNFFSHSQGIPARMCPKIKKQVYFYSALFVSDHYMCIWQRNITYVTEAVVSVIIFSHFKSLIVCLTFRSASCPHPWRSWEMLDFMYPHWMWWSCQSLVLSGMSILHLFA